MPTRFLAGITGPQPIPFIFNRLRTLSRSAYRTSAAVSKHYALLAQITRVWGIPASHFLHPVSSPFTWNLFTGSLLRASYTSDQGQGVPIP